MDDTILEFNYPTDSPSIIKVIGVGGGGGNAVTHMYKEGIHDVTFVLCNTDNQALLRSDVPVKITLGREITQGLGAGNKPERAMMAAEESLDDIRKMLSDGTKMVFITAGMGGGTGTGAAPVVAQPAPATLVQTTPAEQTVPVTPAQPAMSTVPTTERTYSLDELANAAMTLMDKGMQNQLQELLASYGVEALPALPREMYGNFATALRGMGANI